MFNDSYGLKLAAENLFIPEAVSRSVLLATGSIILLKDFDIQIGGYTEKKFNITKAVGCVNDDTFTFDVTSWSACNGSFSFTLEGLKRVKERGEICESEVAVGPKPESIFEISQTSVMLKDMKRLNIKIANSPRCYDDDHKDKSYAKVDREDNKTCEEVAFYCASVLDERINCNNIELFKRISFSGIALRSMISFGAHDSDCYFNILCTTMYRDDELSCTSIDEHHKFDTKNMRDAITKCVTKENIQDLLLKVKEDAEIFVLGTVYACQKHLSAKKTDKISRLITVLSKSANRAREAVLSKKVNMFLLGLLAYLCDIRELKSNNSEIMSKKYTYAYVLGRTENNKIIPDCAVISGMGRTLRDLDDIVRLNAGSAEQWGCRSTCQSLFMVRLGRR